MGAVDNNSHVHRDQEGHMICSSSSETDDGTPESRCRSVYLGGERQYDEAF